MKKNNIAVAFICLTIIHSSIANAKKTIVAVIDTGVNETIRQSDVLCKHGHVDFTSTSIIDTMGHGSHISGIIDQYAKGIIAKDNKDIAVLNNKKIDYCQVIIKFFDKNSKEKEVVKNMVKAIKWATTLKVDVINISAGGIEPDEEERIAIKKALDSNIKIIVAAGNNSCNLGTEDFEIINKQITSKKCYYYPAMYDPRITIVGNLDENGGIAESSNYGKYVSTWEVGTNVLSYGTDVSLNLYPSTGTSQAAAVKTGKIVHQLLKIKSSR